MHNRLSVALVCTQADAPFQECFCAVQDARSARNTGHDQVCVACRFSDLNLPPKNWTFPCTVATLGEIKVQSPLMTCIPPAAHACHDCTVVRLCLKLR